MRETILKHLLILNPKLVIIFGSYAKGVQNSDSDIDIAFFSEDKISNWQRWQVAQDIAIGLNIDVDLIDMNSANDVLKFEIVSHGEIILNKNMDHFLDKCYIDYMRLNDDRGEILKYYER